MKDKKKYSIIKKRIKYNTSKPKLTCQIRNSDHEIKIFHRKKVKKKYDVRFLANSMLKDKFEKKINKNRTKPCPKSI